MQVFDFRRPAAESSTIKARPVSQIREVLRFAQDFAIRLRSGQALRAPAHSLRSFAHARKAAQLAVLGVISILLRTARQHNCGMA